MILLRAVNEILTALGEYPVTTVEAKNPTVSIILRAISQECKEVQLRGWWFNKYKTKLLASQDGKIQAPADLINWTWVDHPSTVRGNLIIDTQNMTPDWRVKGEGSVEGFITIEIDFEELPPSVANWVVKRALVTAYINDFGYEEIVQEYQRQAAMLESQVMDDHLKHQRYDTAKSNRFQRIARHRWR